MSASSSDYFPTYSPPTDRDRDPDPDPEPDPDPHPHSHPHPYSNHHRNHHDFPNHHRDFDPARHFAPESSFFNEAFHRTPSPPTTSFLDSLLNPIESDTPSFSYPGVREVSPPRRQAHSPLPPMQSHNMSPTRRAPGRLPNGFSNLVDLTADSSEATRRPLPRRQSPTPGPSQKRLKQNDATPINVANKTEEAKMDEIDLSGDRLTVHEVLRKQREEAVKAQQKPEEQATTFNTFTCVICMDTPTDLTATACGHLFCHTCLMEALIAGENRSAPGEPRRSQCPVCRKVINRSKGSDIVPLLLKKGLATQPRRKTTPKVT